MVARALAAHELTRPCDAGAFDFGDVEPGAAAVIVGQERARAAVDFAIAMPHPGHHLFVMGPAGSGRKTLVRQAIAAQVAQDGISRSDWVYVNNFEQPHRPLALELPAGRGAKLRADMRALVDDLRTMIPATFESEEYAAEVERINTEFKERAEQALSAVSQEAQRRGLAMLHTPVGFTFAPQKDGEVMSQEVFEALQPEERKAIQQAVNDVQEQLVRVLRSSVRLRKEHADRVREFSRSMTRLAVEHALEDIHQRYTDLPRVHAYIDAVRDDVIEHADNFRARGEEESVEAQIERQAALARYEVNLVLDATGSDGGPIVDADLPTYQNLVGRVDHFARFGMLVTDFRLIKGGALHRANGGYLVIDAIKLLTQPFAWAGLKRALMRGEIRIEPMAEMFGIASTTQLEPEPIPLKVKVVLVGERDICALLQAYDPEFGQLFRVVADVGDDMPCVPQTQRDLARALVVQTQVMKLSPPSADALARLIEHGARLAGDTTRITAQVQRLLDVLVEADHLARRQQRARVEAADISAAIGARRERAARVDERRRDAVLRDILMIDSAGERVGQVNGLTVYEVGDEIFGAPARITATSRLGDGQVVDVQRETRMGGPVHAKGVLILSSFLAARFSRLRPHSIIASLVFEQTYGFVEGDSASLAELVALLSSVADVPVKQCFAVTGSVNQFGDVQAIGGVNEKIEGFFDVCTARGLDGTHGVIVPEANVAHLMLRADLVDAVAAGRFAVHAVRHVDDAIELLTGLSAGDATVPRDDTVNGRIARRLREYASIRRGEPRALRRQPPPRGRRVVEDGGAP